MGFSFRKHFVRLFGVRCSYLCRLVRNFDWPLITASLVVIGLTMLTYKFISGFREQVERNFLSVEANIVTYPQEEASSQDSHAMLERKNCEGESCTSRPQAAKAGQPDQWAITGKILCNGFTCAAQDETLARENNAFRNGTDSSEKSLTMNVSAEFTDENKNQYYGVLDNLNLRAGTFSVRFVEPTAVRIVNVSILVNYQQDDCLFLPTKNLTATWSWTSPDKDVRGSTFSSRRKGYGRSRQNGLSTVATPLIPLLLVFALSILVGLFQLNATETRVHLFPYRQLLSFKYYMSILLAMMFSALMIYSIVMLMQSFGNSERARTRGAIDRVTSLGFAYVFNGRYAEKATNDWILSLTYPEEEMAQSRQEGPYGRWPVAAPGESRNSAGESAHAAKVDDTHTENIKVAIKRSDDEGVREKIHRQSDDTATETAEPESDQTSSDRTSESTVDGGGEGDGKGAMETTSETNTADETVATADSPLSRGFGAPLWVILISVLGSAIFTIQLLVNSLKDSIRFDDILDKKFKDAGKNNGVTCDGQSAAASENSNNEDASAPWCIRSYVRKRVKLIIQHQFYILFSPLGAIFVYQVLVSSDSIGHPATVGIAAFSAGFAINNLLRKALSVSEDLLDTANQKLASPKK